MTAILRSVGFLKNLGESYRATLPIKYDFKQDSFVSMPRYARSIVSHTNLTPSSTPRWYAHKLHIKTFQAQPHISPQLLTYTEPLLIFDLETSDLQGSMIEFSGIKLYPNAQAEQCTQRIRPLKPIKPRATDIHRITNADLQDEPDFSQIADSLWDFTQDCTLAGYNIKRFDIPCLRREFARVGKPDFAKHAKKIDVYQLFNRQRPKSLPPRSRKLQDASMFYCNEPVMHAHTATGDTEATFKVLYQQLLKMAYPIPLTVDELHQWLDKPKNAKNNKLRLLENEHI